MSLLHQEERDDAARGDDLTKGTSHIAMAAVVAALIVGAAIAIYAIAGRKPPFATAEISAVWAERDGVLAVRVLDIRSVYAWAAPSEACLLHRSGSPWHPLSRNTAELHVDALQEPRPDSVQEPLLISRLSAQKAARKWTRANARSMERIPEGKRIFKIIQKFRGTKAAAAKSS